MDVAAKSLQVKGSLSVGREAAVGGNASVRGSVKVGHNLKVEGMIEAQNIKCCSKGLFQTAEKLNAEYPEPKNGWWAFVGNSFPAAVYVADGGEWKATGQTGGEDLQVDITYWEGRFSGLEAEHDADMQAMETQHNTELEAERQARAAADTAEAAARAAADSTEATARQTADTTLQGNIDALEQKHDEELAALEEKHDNELQQERLDRGAADTAIRLEISQMANTLQESIDALEQKHDEELAALEEKHDNELQQEGERHDEDIEDLWKYVAPIEATIAAAPSVIAVGRTTDCILRCTASRKGVSLVGEEDVVFYIDQQTEMPGKQPTSKTVSHEPTSPTTYTHSFMVDYKNGKMLKTVTTEITAVYPTYCGAVGGDWRPDESVRSLPEFLRTGKAGRYEGIDIDHGKAVIAYPASYGALSSIKDGNGYEVKDSYTVTEEYIHVGREVVLYRFYVLTEAVTASGVTLIAS